MCDSVVCILSVYYPCAEEGSCAAAVNEYCEEQRCLFLYDSSKFMLRGTASTYKECYQAIAWMILQARAQFMEIALMRHPSRCVRDQNRGLLGPGDLT